MTLHSHTSVSICFWASYGGTVLIETLGAYQINRTQAPALSRALNTTVDTSWNLLFSAKHRVPHLAALKLQQFLPLSLKPGNCGTIWCKPIYTDVNHSLTWNLYFYT